MKKLIASLLITVLVIGVMPVGVKAVDTTKCPIPSKFISSYNKPITVYPDSSQWACINEKWRLATPDFHQAYANAWAYYEGKWYYIDNNADMAQNEILRDSDTQVYYYLTSDGSMMTNDYVHGWQGNLFYAKADGSLIDFNGSVVNDTSTGVQENATITKDQAEKIALDKVKAIKYPNSKISVVIIPYIDTYEKTVDGKSGYIVTIGEDTTEHTVPTERVFVDKSTGEVFDAFNVSFGIGDEKLKEFK